MTGQQLKNSILQMAVQGKLVPQDPNDEPTSVLLERIRKEKEQLIKEGKIKKEKNPSYIFRGADNLPYEKVGKNEPVCIADEVPFEIPESWEWVRLKNLVKKEIKRGKSPKYAVSSNIQVFAQKCNVKAGGIDMTLAKYLDDTVFPKYPEQECMRDSDIVINSTGNGTLGRIGMFHDSDRINENIIVPDSHVTVIRASEFLSADYIFYVLNYYQPYLEKSCSGSTNQTELKPAVISELFIPVPPVNEQTRIITKLIEALNLSKLYGEKEILLQKYNQDFPEQLKKSILQYAIQGKLVPQNPSGEPAAVLLERIRAEKQKLIAEGKIKKDKHESVIFRRDNSHYEKLDGIERCIEDQIPFEIPESWEWVRLGTISTYSYTKQKINAQNVDPKIWGLDLEDIEKGGRLLAKKSVGERKAVGDKTFFDKGDILYSKLRPYLLKILIAPDCGICTPEIVPFKVFGRINPEYIVIFLKCPYVDAVINSDTYGVKMPRVGTETMTSLFVPIPPLSEQCRIVEKQRELFDKISLV